MTIGHSFDFRSERMTAMGSGALWWEARKVLCVSDLHLGKSDRIARRGGAALPPYDIADTLNRLATDVATTNPSCIICLGDSFDDLEAASSLSDRDAHKLATLQAGREWIWIEGNHDPGPINIQGTHLAEIRIDAIVFRHIAEKSGIGEVSGHYHPKAAVRLRGRTITRPAFLHDGNRLVMPAYGTYTGGLNTRSAVLTNLMQPDATAILTGHTPVPFPMPRAASK